jgi:hypothetical protein
MTTFVVPCLIYKLIMILDKIGSKGQDQSNNFCLSLNQRTTFCAWYNYTKYENTHFICEYKNIISFSLIDEFFCCRVLPSTYCFTNQMHRKHFK